MILQDIFTLGLNFSPIADYRRKYLVPIIQAVRLGQQTIAKARVGLQAFYTAFEMSMSAWKQEQEPGEEQQ